MRSIARYSASFLLLAWASIAFAQVAANDPDQRPSGKGWGETGSEASGSARPRFRRNGISYHGGPLILGTTNVHYIWYGDWSGNTAQTILDDFASNIGGSAYFNINTTYYDRSKTLVSNSVALHSDNFDNYSHGAQLSDSDVQEIVAAQRPIDTNGVYFVLTSADVAETSGFGTLYCAWHKHASINGLDIKFAFVGTPDRYPAACEAQLTSPNGNAGADGMASAVAHELDEMVTDPDVNAWYDTRGRENGDKCAWTFGTTYVTANGSWANVRLGTRDYLIQQSWVNAAGGYCALSYPGSSVGDTDPSEGEGTGHDGTNPWPLIK